MKKTCSRCDTIIPMGQTLCGSCTTADNRRRTTKTARHGLNTKRWRLLRHHRLALDQHRCTLRLEGCTGTATTVHLAPELRGNHRAATLDDLRSACHHCHGMIDAPRAHAPNVA